MPTLLHFTRFASLIGFILFSQPIEGLEPGCSPYRWNPDGSPITEEPSEPFKWQKEYAPWPDRPGDRTGENIKTGDINCRYHASTEDDNGPHVCAELARSYNIDLEKFLILNPSVKQDCSGLQRKTEYCVAGFIQPNVAYDGLCGPPHGDAECRMTTNYCCNSQTWTCGNTPADCAEGTCWEGRCRGHTVYSMDGKCGRDHNNLLCAGVWGTCCSEDGTCGSGEAFCAKGKCQSGNCEGTAVPNYLLTPDGRCGPVAGWVCGNEHGYCCNKDERCSFDRSECTTENGCHPEHGYCDIDPTQFSPPTKWFDSNGDVYGGHDEL